MRCATVLLAVFVMFSMFPAAAQNTPKPTSEAAAAGPQPARPAAMSDADVEAMRADLAHMRILVGQMQRNLGFVDSGLTPLKHQFELEIEMWNVLINDMQRRLNARVEPAANKPAPRPQ